MDEKKDPLREAQAKGKEFIEGVRSGTMSRTAVLFGLRVGAGLAFVSLFFNYFSFGGLGTLVGKSGVSGWDLLNLGHGISLNSLLAFSIPASALFGLYLDFGEPKFKLLKMELPGRAKRVHLIGLIVAGLGILGCFKFLADQIRLGSLLGLAGLALLAFAYFKLWQQSPET